MTWANNKHIWQEGCYCGWLGRAISGANMTWPTISTYGRKCVIVGGLGGLYGCQHDMGSYKKCVL